MKKTIPAVLVVLILFQNCVVYQDKSVSLDEAHNMNKVKLISTYNKVFIFENIVKEDSLYYGELNGKMILISPRQVQSVHLKDGKESKKQTTIAWICVGVGIPAVFILLVIYEAAKNGWGITL